MDKYGSLARLKTFAVQDEAVQAYWAGFDLAKSRALLRVLTSTVWATDPQGEVTAPQVLWERYTGQTWEQYRGTGWLSALHPDDRGQAVEAVQRAIQAGDFFFSLARIWHAPTQSYRHNVARAVPIVEDGQVTQWVGTSTDVEDQFRAEEALREADRHKDEFIAVLAHELRAPLAPIRNAAQILRRRTSDDMQLGWTRDVIERQVSHMSHMLNDLLDVSRIREQKVELTKERVTLDSILEYAVEVSRPLLEQRGHHLELNILSGQTYVEADRQRMTQVFSNLLTNAAKYTDPGGRISLSVSSTEHDAVISVADNGTGIAAEFLPKVFQVFSQAQATPSRLEGGLGLGLTIAKALTEMHGGSIEARSEGPGHGSEFTVKLPLARSRERSEGDRRRPQPQPARRFRIVVADDDADSGETLKVLLELMGHTVHLAADGQEAADLALAIRPDVVLLDIAMPKLDGYAVAQRLRGALPEATLVAATGRGQPEDIRKAMAAGFDRFCLKPVAPEELELILSRVGDRRPPDAATARRLPELGLGVV